MNTRDVATNGGSTPHSRPFVERFVYPTLGGLVVACVAAAITYIIARTNEQPDAAHQQLFADVNEYVPAAVVAAQALANREGDLVGITDPKERHRLFQSAFDANRRKWQTNSAEVAGLIRANLGDLQASWSELDRTVSDYLALNADPNTERGERIARLQEAVGPTSRVTEADWDALERGLGGDKAFAEIPSQVRRAFADAYTRLGSEILNLEGELLQEIVG
jgi:hypothetical protein